MADKKEVEFPAKYDKVLKKISEWKEAADSKGSDELQRDILKAQGVLADIEQEMTQDIKLQTLKEDLKLLSSSYRESMTEERAKSAYCLFLLRQRGIR